MQSFEIFLVYLEAANEMFYSSIKQSWQACQPAGGAVHRQEG